MTAPILALVVARARDGVIGKDGALPWRLKSDLIRFKAITLGKPVIMGRKTWDSLPRKPLPGRMNLVLSRDGAFEPQGALVCESLNEALQIGREQAAEDAVGEVCVIGGAGVFAAALPRARRLYLTEVEAEVDGDVYLDALDEAGWTEVSREAHPAQDETEDQFPFVFRVLERSV